MATSPAGEWSPVFPGDTPPHWAALVSTSMGVLLLRDALSPQSADEWLHLWFCHFTPGVADRGEASYLYVGLSDRYWVTAADGLKRSSAVIGVGTGAHFGEPPDAVASTVERILECFCRGSTDTTQPGDFG